MEISSNIIQKLLPLLWPPMVDKNQRRGHLDRARLDGAVLNRLDWDIPADTFITEMVKKLMVKKLDDVGEFTSGKPALCALLLEICQYVSGDKQFSLDELIVEVQTQSCLTVKCNI